MAKIAVFEVEPWEGRYLAEKLGKSIAYSSTKKIGKSDLAKIKDCDTLLVFVYSQVTEEVLAAMPKLKLVCTMSTGFDHINLAACAKRGITVCNVPSYGENTVAEQTMALMLAISRRIVESVNRTRHGDWSLEGLRGFDLKGKRLGVVGAGRIGTHVIKMAKGFEMDVVASGGMHPDKKLAKTLGFKFVSFDELLSTSDVITFHVPYCPATHHLLNLKNIHKLKRGCVVINTARGGVIETQALLKALDKGIISYAGLDVLEEECFVKEHKAMLSEDFAASCDIKTLLEDHVLLQHRNVLVTPHNAFNTKEALIRILDTTTQNVMAFQKKKPLNVVKTEAAK